MFKEMIPPTTTRVERHTSAEVNERIRRGTDDRIERYRGSSPEQIQRRLAELDREWDIERTLEANAASLMLITLALGKTVSRRWYAFPAVVAAFLLQHAVQGWCPPVPIFRRLGVRTAREIEKEKRALMEILGEREG